MKTLLIMRHAKSDYPAHIDSDFARPLNNRGQNDVPRMAALLRQYGPLPEYILASAAVRAQQTAESIAEHLGLTAEQLILDEALYLASPETLLNGVGQLPVTAERALLIAHNPGLEELIYLLSGARVELPTAGVATIVCHAASWSEIQPGRGHLLYFVMPRLIKAITA
ncbi:MAG: phosphohistidine phosphatase [Candidatus Latescibacterota bacterium]